MVDTACKSMKLLRRNLSLMLAVRYLNPLRSMFSIITLICLCGVALGVMILIVVLSVMEGLQREIESHTLAFTPHYVLSINDTMRRITLNESVSRWPELRDQIATLPGVVSAYPQLENDAFAQSPGARLTVRFTALEPGNESQLKPLLPMLREGSFDFGAGLDQECVISHQTAEALGLRVGEKLHLTPVGSIDEIASIYSMIQLPLQTHEDQDFLAALSAVFEGSRAANGGEIVPVEKLTALVERIRAFEYSKLRNSEKEALEGFYEDATAHMGGVPFTPQEKLRWLERAAELAALDRDKEDGKAVKSINEMVMPVDLTIIGIYQPPENMPGPNIYMPLPIAQDVMGYGATGNNDVMGLCIRIENPNLPGDIEERISKLLPDLTASTSENPMGLHWSIAPWTKSFEKWYELIANERIMMSFVLSIISLIASFCIMAVMFTMSMQRRREIAVLQALGATPAKIMGIFTWQGVIIGFVGAILGIILALLVLHYRLEIQAALASVGLDPFPMEAHGITLPAVYSPSTFAWQAIRAFIMVTLASIIPAFFISRQDPSKALRSN